jgi:hypothetical protein
MCGGWCPWVEMASVTPDARSDIVCNDEGLWRSLNCDEGRRAILSLGENLDVIREEGAAVFMRSFVPCCWKGPGLCCFSLKDPWQRECEQPIVSMPSE